VPKSNIYPLVMPPGCGYPQIVPVHLTPAKRSTWREWGRIPRPAPISIGLPRASSVTPPSADRPTEVWAPPATTVAPINMQTVRVIEDIKKRNSKL
jgi:hypothetical protein